MQNELVRRILEQCATVDLDVETFLKCTLKYISNSSSRTYFMQEFLQGLRRGIFFRIKNAIKTKSAIPTTSPGPFDQSHALQKSEHQKAMVSDVKPSLDPIEPINEPVPITSMAIGANTTRFNLPAKKTGEFNWTEDLPSIQKLIFRKAFNENAISRNDINIKDLATDPRINDFLRNQVDFVFQTIKEAKEKACLGIVNSKCPVCNKQIDLWGMQQGNSEEIIVFFKNINAAKKGDFSQVYHKNCLFKTGKK